MATDTEVLALVDQTRLRNYLSTIAPLGDSFEVGVLSGGLSNLTYVIRSGQHEYVVRRRPIGKVAAGAHDMAREHRVQAALQGSGLPIAVTSGYSDDESIVGAPFYVMSRVAGVVFHTHADVADLSAEQARAISEATVEVLDRLHRVDYAAVGLGQLGRPEGFVARRIERWLDQWRRSDHRDHPLLEPLAAKLTAAVPAHTASTLIHGDYRLGNMLIALDETPRVAAVLDWEMSTLGDPMTDLAHLLVYWERTRGRLTHESQNICTQPGFLSGQALAERYAAHSGRDIAHLDFYLAFEHWRAAIIKEAIYMRSQRGEHPDGGGSELGETVIRHLDEAAEILGAGART